MSTLRALCLLLALSACGGSGTTAPFQQPPPPPPPPGGGNPPTQASVAMNSTDDGYGTATHTFNPAAVTIARSGTVTWTNNTGFLHNVTFAPATGAPSNIPSFNGSSASRTFSTAGTFSYQCTNHVGMNGQVVVQ